MSKLVATPDYDKLKFDFKGDHYQCSYCQAVSQVVEPSDVSWIFFVPHMFCANCHKLFVMWPWLYRKNPVEASS